MIHIHLNAASIKPEYKFRYSLIQQSHTPIEIVTDAKCICDYNDINEIILAISYCVCNLYTLSFPIYNCLLCFTYCQQFQILIYGSQHYGSMYFAAVFDSENFVYL